MATVPFIRHFCLILLIVSAFPQAYTQEINPAESNWQAIILVEKSLQAYGGQEADDLLKLSLIVKSNFVNEGQSVNPLAPFENYPLKIELKLDRKLKRVLSCSDSAIAGDFVFTDCTFLNNGKGYAVNHITKTYRATESEPWTVQFLLPHKTVLEALHNRASLRLIDPSTVSFATTSGQLVTLAINRETSLIDKIVHVSPMGASGDGMRELRFKNYKKTSGLMIPTQLTMSNRNDVHGLVENQYIFETAVTEFDIDLEDFDLSGNYSEADYSYRKPFEIRKLARDIYLFENVSSATGQWSYNVLVAVFDDFVVVGEAPVSSAISENVLQKIRELAPGKNIRYLVQSHHHSDHLAGIRSYVAEKVTILTGGSSVPLIEKIAAAPHRLDPDRLQQNPAKPIVEVVQDKRVIQDAHHELVIYNIGPSPHAKDMLVVYFPSERIVYQSDMINDGEYPENATTRDFMKKIKGLGLQPLTIAGLHGKLRGKQMPQDSER